MVRPLLPPVHLIVGFEAAARLNSFKRAAHELSVTPSAISQRVRKLEDHLGVKLFERIVRGVELTPAGRRYHDDVAKVLAELHAVTVRSSRVQLAPLTLAMNNVVAQEMVIPNLAVWSGNRSAAPIEIVTRTSMKTFDAADADAGIRIGAGGWAGFEHRVIGPLSAVPMCAPALAPAIRDWDDLFGHTLYCAKSRRAETLEALRHPLSGGTHPNVVAFQTLPEAIRAAESGLGIIGGLMPLMGNFVVQGRLRPALDVRRPLPEDIVFIHAPAHADRLDGLFDWLVDCYRRLPALDAGAPTG